MNQELYFITLNFYYGTRPEYRILREMVQRAEFCLMDKPSLLNFVEKVKQKSIELNLCHLKYKTRYNVYITPSPDKIRVEISELVVITGIRVRDFLVVED